MILLLCISIILCWQHTLIAQNVIPSLEENLARNKPVSASFTCGHFLQFQNESFCYQTLSQCDSLTDCTLSEHLPGLITDGDSSTFWQSPTAYTFQTEALEPDIYITVDLLQPYLLSSLKLSTELNYRLPSRLLIEASTDNVTYLPMTYIATNCSENPQHCLIIDSQNNSTEISVSLSNDGLESMANIARFIRVKLLSFSPEIQNNLQQYYTISEIFVEGRCNCNGFGRSCIISPEDNERYTCQCDHSTCGVYCESCCEGFQGTSYQSRLVNSEFKCQRCDNCSISLLSSLDEVWGGFNTTAAEFDTLVLNSLDDLPDLRLLKENFNNLSRNFQLPLTLLSSLKYSLTGLYTNLSYYLPQSYLLGCTTPLNTSILQYYSSLRDEVDKAVLLLASLELLSQNMSSEQLQQSADSSKLLEAITLDNMTFTDSLETLKSIQNNFKELIYSSDKAIDTTVEHLSIILYNHFFTNNSLNEALLLSSTSTRWYRQITELVLTLHSNYSAAINILQLINALEASLDATQMIVNQSYQLNNTIHYTQLNITQYHQLILQFISDITSLKGSISQLIDMIRLLKQTAEQLQGSLISCLVQLQTKTDLLKQRVSLYQTSVDQLEKDLRLLVNTSTGIKYAESYVLSGELYSKMLVELAVEIVRAANLAGNGLDFSRFFPSGFDSLRANLSIAGVKLQESISSAQNISSLRDTVNQLVDLIFQHRVCSLFTSVNNSADIVSLLSNSVMSEAITLLQDSTKSLLDNTNNFNLYGMLLSTVTDLEGRIFTDYQQDEYKSTLTPIRENLLAQQAELQSLEAGIASSLADIISAINKIPSIQAYNDMSTQLHNQINAETNNSDIANIADRIAILEPLTSNIQSKNQNLLSKLESLYSRLNLVHQELQLPKVPLRLDGQGVVSLQPPQLEQLENSTYSSDFKFYFEPILKSGTTQFLLFYAGPAVTADSVNKSILSQEDYIALTAVDMRMKFSARINGISYDGRHGTLLSNSRKYVITLKRVGPFFSLLIDGDLSTFPSTSRNLHNFQFRPSHYTAYFLGGVPSNVEIATGLQPTNNFRGCVYLALILNWGLYSLWDMRYHENLLSSVSGLDCIRHSEIPTDYDESALSFKGNGHAFVAIPGNFGSLLYRFDVTPQTLDGLIMTSFGTNIAGYDFIISIYLRDGKFSIDAMHWTSSIPGNRTTFTSDNVDIRIGSIYSLTLVTSSQYFELTISHGSDSYKFKMEMAVDYFHTSYILFGGISDAAVNQSPDYLRNWNTPYFRYFRGCISKIILNSDQLVDVLNVKTFNFNKGTTFGTTFGCPANVVPEYSITKTNEPGYIQFSSLSGLEGVLNSAPSVNPIDFSKEYSLSLLVTRPTSPLKSRSVLLHIADTTASNSTLEVFIDNNLDAVLEVVKSGQFERTALPLDTSKAVHAITVYSNPASNIIEFYVDSYQESIGSNVNLVIPFTLQANHEFFVGGNTNQDESFAGCIKEVVLLDSLLNLGMGTFVSTNLSQPKAYGISHDGCGFDTFNGVMYGAGKTLPHPIVFSSAIRSVV